MDSTLADDGLFVFNDLYTAVFCEYDQNILNKMTRLTPMDRDITVLITLNVALVIANFCILIYAFVRFIRHKLLEKRLAQAYLQAENPHEVNLQQQTLTSAYEQLGQLKDIPRGLHGPSQTRIQSGTYSVSEESQQPRLSRPSQQLNPGQHSGIQGSLGPSLQSDEPGGLPQGLHGPPPTRTQSGPYSVPGESQQPGLPRPSQQLNPAQHTGHQGHHRPIQQSDEPGGLPQGLHGPPPTRTQSGPHSVPGESQHPGLSRPSQQLNPAQHTGHQGHHGPSQQSDEPGGLPQGLHGPPPTRTQSGPHSVPGESQQPGLPRPSQQLNPAQHTGHQGPLGPSQQSCQPGGLAQSLHGPPPTRTQNNPYSASLESQQSRISGRSQQSNPAQQSIQARGLPQGVNGPPPTYKVDRIQLLGKVNRVDSLDHVNSLYINEPLDQVNG